jgi:hypothetical protein
MSHVLLSIAILSACVGGCSAIQTPAVKPLGINLAGPADWNTELPFTDVFRLSRAWISQHAVGVGGAENNEALTKVLTAANRSERMGRLYDRYLDAWRDVGGGDVCCIFSSVGAFSKWGSWGLIEHYTDDTPKYRAVLRRVSGR